jgi:peroxiredoxin
VRLLAISVDDRTGARKVWQDVASKHFTVLSDPGAAVIRKYGILHPHGGHGASNDIALDTTLLIDGKGIERWRMVSQTLPDLPTADEVLARIRQEQGSAK